MAYIDERHWTPETHPDLQAAMRYLDFIRTHRSGWPPEFFELLLKLMCHCSWEPVPTRVFLGRLQFMYSQRAADDKAYPPDPVLGSPWYFGGSYNRGEPKDVGLERVSRAEFKIGHLTNPRLVAVQNWSKEARGPDAGLVFLCDYVGDTPANAEWRHFEDPPAHMIEAHRILVTNLIKKIQSGDMTLAFWEDPR